MVRLLLLAAVMAAAVACGDDHRVTPPGDASIDSPSAPTGLTACLDRPGETAAVPTGKLPCELLPPGFKQ